MPVFLDEQMIGIDSDVIGFPHLLVCMGFVVWSEDGNGRQSLSGIHLTDTEASARAFPFFAREFNATQPTKIHAIYGCCNRVIRYSSGNLKAAWRNEMKGFAQALGFKGPARGFDTGIINPVDGTYVQYDLETTGRPIRIFYKRNEKMNYQGGGGSLPMVMFSEPGRTVPPELANNPKVVAKFQDRVEMSGGSKLSASPRKKKFSGKTRTLTEVDYSLRLDEEYVF